MFCFHFFLSMAEAISLPKLMFYSRVFIQTCNMPQIMQECFCKAIGFVWKIREGSWLLICSRLQVFRDGGTLTLIGSGPSPRMMQTHFIFVALFLQREKEWGRIVSSLGTNCGMEARGGPPIRSIDPIIRGPCIGFITKRSTANAIVGVMRSLQNVETLFIRTLDWNENMPSKPNDHMNDISFIMACTYLRGLQWSPLIVVQCALNDWANSAEEISRYLISSQCQNCGTYLVYGFMISHIRIAVPNLFSPKLEQHPHN